MELITILFWISSVCVMPLWLMMILIPNSKITKTIVGSNYCLFPMLICYSIAVIPSIPNLLMTLATQMPTPEIVKDLFSDDYTIMLGWLHYLALDTLAGRWIWTRLISQNKPIYQSAPTLIMCMMVAPLGVILGIITTLNRNENFKSILID